MESTEPAPRVARFSTLDGVALALALLLALPVISVCLSLLWGPDAVFRHLAATVLPDYVVTTLVLGALVVAGVLAIGMPAAWLVARCQFPGKHVLEATLVLPLAAPAYVLAYAYTDLLDSYGPVQSTLRAAFGWQTGEYWFPNVRSLGGAALMLILTLYPYVYLLARAHFLNESATALEASRTLGRGPWRAFFSVSLPLARPALAAGVALALMEAFADYGTVAYSGVPTFTLGIYRAWFSYGDTMAASQLAALLIGLVALALFAERIARGGARYHEAGRRDRRPPLVKLTGGRGFGAAAFCSLPPLLGFLLPALVLSQLLVESGGPQRLFWNHLANSVALATAAGIVATLIALVLGFARHRRPKSPAARAAELASLGYAVPGAVLAIGIAIPFAAIGQALAAAAGAKAEISTGLILASGVAALIFAYVVRFLAVALRSVNAGFERVTPSIDGAARMLAHGEWDALLRVHAPLLLPSALTAALIVFVDVMKELPATLMLRPFNFDTLAVAANNYAADERLAQAAAPSLAIVAAGVIPCFLLIRGIAAAVRGREDVPPALP